MSINNPFDIPSYVDQPDTAAYPEPVNKDTLTEASVPPNTIKTSSDIYAGRFFTDRISLMKPYLDTTVDIYNSISGKEKKLDRDPFIDEDGPFEGRKKSHVQPIGTWIKFYEQDTCAGVSDDYYWGESEEYPDRIPEDVATKCSGGSEMGINKYPLSDLDRFYGNSDSFPSPHMTGSIPNCFGENCFPSEIERHQCVIGRFARVNGTVDKCAVSGIHYPSLCQLGDYVETIPKCKEQCINSISRFDDQKEDYGYCEYARDRLCEKRKGDPLKRTPDGESIVYSDINWIEHPTCIDYCGPPFRKFPTEDCERNKTDYCSINNEQGWDANKIDYCKEYLLRFFTDISEAEKKEGFEEYVSSECDAEFLGAIPGSNIFTQGDKGCSSFCNDTDPLLGEEYCKAKKTDYCSGMEFGPNNLITDPEQASQCYSHCKDNEGEGECDDIIKNACSGLSFGALSDPIEGTDPEMLNSNICGCFLPPETYEETGNKVIDAYTNMGWKLDVTDIKPECSFGECKNVLSIRPVDIETDCSCADNLLSQDSENICELNEKIKECDDGSVEIDDAELAQNVDTQCLTNQDYVPPVEEKLSGGMVFLIVVASLVVAFSILYYMEINYRSVREYTGKKITEIISGIGGAHGRNPNHQIIKDFGDLVF